MLFFSLLCSCLVPEAGNAEPSADEIAASCLVLARDFGGGFVSLTRLTRQGKLPIISQQEKYALADLLLTEKGSFIFTMDIPGNPKSKYAHDGYIVPSVLLKTTASNP